MKLFLCLIFSIYFFSVSLAQDFHRLAISDESKVKPYVLPDIFTANDGTKISSIQQWEQIRRNELITVFSSQMYGKVPGKPKDLWFEELEVNNKALDGLATRRQVIAHFTKDRTSQQMQMLIYLPNQIKKPVPVFLCLNFDGNHTVTFDPQVDITKSWVANNETCGITNHLSNEKARGMDTISYPIEMVLKSGYGFVTIYYGDIDPDFNDGFQNGVHPLFYKNNQTKPAPDEWGSIGAWAWGLSRAMDYFETVPEIDFKKVAVLGHSRLGKATVWAGALDKRFAIVISNNSGCGGAALSKRIFGETVRAINTNFPHWFCENFKQYNDKEENLPIDQHMLLALIAPRPLYVASASEDLWADPRGEFLSAFEASKVYHLYGLKGIESEIMPQINLPIMNTVGYHIRTGRHNLTRYDWEQYIKFADLHFNEVINGSK
jgi:hypothetical protein